MLPTPEELESDLIDRFLTPQTSLPPAWLNEIHREHYEHEPLEPTNLLHCDTSRPLTTLEFTTSGLGGEVKGYKEVTRTVHTGDAKNSTSMQRAPADSSSFIRGKTGHFPFAPGSLRLGLHLDEDSDEEQDGGGVVDAFEKGLELSRGGIQTIPPGFERGLDFDGDAEAEELFDEGQQKSNIDLRPIYRPALANDAEQVPQSGTSRPAPPLDDALEQLLPTDRIGALTTKPSSRKKPVISKRDWAHVVDVNRELLNFKQLVPDMAKEWPFELDTFQKEAVYHMENGDSVFVAAHTSAGKTVVAEYATALAMKHMTRAIYTSPIKALSNQKFRDFKQTFGAENVGILTGDVQINPEASCLIMTTEILRSMLYKGADLIRDIEWVIFDEVHYVNDMERGVVWEEVIIMLPPHVGLVLLSATVPNTKEFANWVGRTQHKDIYVISTPKRPVPLEHFLYAGKEMHQVLDARGDFQESGIKAANEALRRKQDKEREAAGLPPPVRGGARGGAAAGNNARGGGRGQPNVRGGGGQVGRVSRGASSGAFTRGRGGASTSMQRDRNLWIHLIGLLRKKELLPVVIFTFSKNKCEENAASMPNTDLCNAAERSEIHIVIEKSLTRLKGSDKKLPQIERMRELLSRGIGVHHGGMLPIVKEMVELLFARGLVKCLFATETFAMGINMPARCVVFSSIRKHDGRSFRELLSGEYTQMSGRAGRRGLDATGVVLIVADGEVPDTATLHKMLLGSPTKLSSQFRLTYNMILNLLRVEALKVEDMIRRSFSENAAQRLLPDQQKKVVESEKELVRFGDLRDVPEIENLRRFYDISARLVELNQEVISGAFAHPSANKVFTTGRVVILRDGRYPGSPAILLRPAPTFSSEASVEDQRHARPWIVQVFLSVPVQQSTKESSAPAPPRWPAPMPRENSEDLVYEISAVSQSSISLVTKHMVKVDPVAIIDKRSKTAMDQSQAEMLPTLKNWNPSSPTDQPEEADWSKIRGVQFREALQNRDEQLARLRPLAGVVELPHFEETYQRLNAEHLLQEQISKLRMAVSDQNLELLPDYQQRVSVLQDLQFIDDTSTVLLKGRVACEINSVNELVLTELILENVLAPYEPEEVVALLSSLVFREKSEATPVLTPRLQEAMNSLHQVTERVNSVQVKHRADSLGEDTSTDIRLGLVEVAYEWARGMPFSQITDLTDVQEGTIVRSITRLDETCREVRDAARVIGDMDLFAKMEQCQALLKRDIIFAASLYL